MLNPDIVLHAMVITQRSMFFGMRGVVITDEEEARMGVAFSLRMHCIGVRLKNTDGVWFFRPEELLVWDTETYDGQPQPLRIIAPSYER